MPDPEPRVPDDCDTDAPFVPDAGLVASFVEMSGAVMRHTRYLEDRLAQFETPEATYAPLRAQAAEATATTENAPSATTAPARLYRAEVAALNPSRDLDPMEWQTPKQVAFCVGVTDATIRNWAAAGYVRSHWISLGRVLVSLADAQAWHALRAGTRAASPR